MNEVKIRLGSDCVRLETKHKRLRIGPVQRLVQEVRVAIRLLEKNAAFSTLIIVTLGLSIVRRTSASGLAAVRLECNFLDGLARFPHEITCANG